MALTLLKTSLTLKEAQSLTGYLSFYAAVVRLGWVFMRPLWSYVAQFPAVGQQRRLPRQVQTDLTWWNTLLPQFNGVLFFNNKVWDTFQLYTDALLQGLGGFFFYNSTKPWQKVKINQSEAFVAQISNYANIYQPGPTVFLDPKDPILINVFEVQAILLAFQLFASRWRYCKIIIYTNSITAFSGLKTNHLRRSPNVSLR